MLVRSGCVYVGGGGGCYIDTVPYLKLVCRLARVQYRYDPLSRCIVHDYLELFRNYQSCTGNIDFNWRTGVDTAVMTGKKKQHSP